MKSHFSNLTQMMLVTKNPFYVLFCRWPEMIQFCIFDDYVFAFLGLYLTPSATLLFNKKNYENFCVTLK